MAKGRKTGGRAKGTPNRATATKAREVAASGLTPLDYMLKVMRNPKGDKGRRDEMAKAAAPYIHPRLSAVEHRPSQLDVSKLSNDELQFLDEIYRRAGASAVGDDTDGTAPAAGARGPGGNGTRH